MAIRAVLELAMFVAVGAGLLWLVFQFARL